MIVVNNFLLNFVELEMKVVGFVIYGMGLDNLSFVVIVEVMGIFVWCVECSEDFFEVVREVFVYDGFVLFDVVIEW